MFGSKAKPAGADAPSFPAPDMGAPRARVASTSVTSIISSDLTITGNVVSGGEVQFDGVIEGDVQAKRLTIGKDGVVRGNVRAVEMAILGRVEGSLSGERVDLKAGCVVTGNIVHKSLSIESGAKFTGRVDQSDDPLNSRSTAPAAIPASSAPAPSASAPMEAPSADPAPPAAAE